MKATLNNPTVFPAGTTVKAYPQSNWPTGLKPPQGAPKGVSVAEGVVAADGSLSLGGLVDGTAYYLAGEVGTQWLYESLVAIEAEPTLSSVAAEVEILNLGTDWSAGDLVGLAFTTTNEGKRANIRHGTAASPVLGGGSTFKVSRTEAVTQAEQDALPGYGTGGQNTDKGAIVGAVRGTAASELQVEGLVGHARNAGTKGQPDACAIFGMAWQRDVGATGRAIAAYLASRNELENGTMTGLEVQVQNKTGADDEVNSVGASDSIGLLISAGGSTNKRGGAGIQFHHPNEWAQLDVGMVASSNNGGPIRSALVQDNSEALRSVQIKGKHSKAAISVAKEAGGVYIGAEERTLAGAATLLEVRTDVEADPLYSFGSLAAVNLRGTLMRNSTGTIQAFVANGANVFTTGTAQGDSGLTFTAGKVFHVGAVGKTSQLRLAEAGLGFYGKAPVARPNVKAAAEVTAKELCEALETLGLVE